MTQNYFYKQINIYIMNQSGDTENTKNKKWFWYNYYLKTINK